MTFNLAKTLEHQMYGFSLTLGESADSDIGRRRVSLLILGLPGQHCDIDIQTNSYVVLFVT